jgi:hypothetical protein
MEKILSEEELDALMKMFSPDQEPEISEGRSADEMFSVVNHEIHRRFFRLPQALDTTMTADGKKYKAKAINIGLGGVFVISDLDIPIGKKIELSIRLPKPEAIINATSTVCWQKKVDDLVMGLGVHFSALEIDHIWAIVSNMKQLTATSLEK